ncbi:unnamed protein product [Dovyalis caffra]|uniref:Uncharacterized protein n=1 Tax=Dovyalis caffra TaxID=77055 RepID=A0AAV1R699_9ROSI|nr:unnamed protein product [Dovyalis caffra]
MCEFVKGLEFKYVVVRVFDDERKKTTMVKLDGCETYVGFVIGESSNLDGESRM